MKTGIKLIAEERERQISKEGWTPEHDDTHTQSELAMAAVCYAKPDWNRGMNDAGDAPLGWPWAGEWWKPLVSFGQYSEDSRIRELQKAGALIAAEIDRLQREKER